MPPSPPARPDRSAYAASPSLFVVKRALLLSSALLVLLAGFGGASEAARRGVISVHIRLVTYPSEVRHVRSFSLRCNPTGGSLPFAARVCRDIRLHPKAMLDPPHRTRPGGQSSTCSGGPFMPEVSVTATANGAARRFDGSPDCSWPGGQAVGVYFDAALKRHDPPCEKRVTASLRRRPGAVHGPDTACKRVRLHSWPLDTPVGEVDPARRDDARACRPTAGALVPA